MLESEEDEVLKLPKTVISEQTSTNGALRRYQEKLIQEYYRIFCSFQKLIKEVSNECKEQLQQRMIRFRDESNQIKKNQENIILNLGKSPVGFEELRDQLKELGQYLINLSLQLREDALAIYSGSYSKLNPIVERAFESCEIYIAQLPHQYSEKLPQEIKLLNENFLQTKQKLVKVLYQIEISCIKEALNTDSEFVKRADDWKKNRFIFIIEEAKKQFDLSNRIDFSSVFENFHTDQKKFTFCFRKLISNLALFSPPSHFSKPDLDSWWEEVLEMTETHKNFISKFIDQFQSKIDQRNQENTQLITALEKELFELATEPEANQAMCDLIPMFKQTQKYYALLIEKLQKYWNMRIDSLYKSFQSIDNFLRPLIENFQSFISESDENHSFVLSETEEIRNQSQSEINQLESDLQMKSDEIIVLSNQDEINNSVQACKEILKSIEEKYNESYSKIISTYDTQPSLLNTLFDKVEKNVMNIMNLRKTSLATEFDNQSSAALNNADPKKKGTSLGQRQQRKLRQKFESKLNTSIPTSSSFSFQLPNGAKYEEISMLELVPQFDDFIDEPRAVELTPHKGKGKAGGNERKTTPVKAKRSGAANAKGPNKGVGGKKGGKGGGYVLDDFDDVEIPEFLLSEVVPKAEDGSVSIFVYTPNNDELSEWSNTFRKLLLTSLNNEYEIKMRRASYKEERAKMKIELDEKMTIHLPRANSIEMNIAQKRINQIESRQAQLEKHFLRAVANFNNGIETIAASLERRKKSMIAECSKMRAFIDNLANMKNATAFAVLFQKFSSNEKQWENYFAKQKNEQKREIDNFTNNFDSVNKRFMETVVLADNSFSEDERRNCNEYFENMKSAVAAKLKEFESIVSNAKDEVSKLHDSLLEEFNSNMTVHKADVAFIESLKQTQIDSKNKFEALLAKNKMMENEVDRLISLVKINENLDLQNRLSDIFQKIDSLRISLSKRAKFLSLIKSTTGQTPFTFSLDLHQPAQNANDDAASTTAKKAKSDSKKGASGNPADEEKKHSKSKKKSKSSAEKNNAGENSNDASASSGAQEGGGVSDSQRLLSLNVQFDNIQKYFFEKVSSLSNDYYNELKTRKTPITRPELIQEQQQECVDKCREIWGNITKDFKSVCEKSNVVFQTQVQSAENISKEMQKKMFSIFSSFYVDQVAKDKSDVQLQFDKSMAVLAKERDEHKAKMNPDTADRNKLDEFKQLIESENDRILRETEAITNFSIQNIECEFRNMSLFTMNLPIFANKLLSLFDLFIQIDDLSSSMNISKGIERKTMRELRKEKARQSTLSVSNDPNGRPFHLRDWPSLPLVMETILASNQRAAQSTAQSVALLKSVGVKISQSSILANFESGNQQTMINLNNGQIDSQNLNRPGSNSSATSLINGSKKKKVAVKGALQNAGNPPPSAKLAPLDADPQTSSSLMSLTKNLDTSLNRAVIIERNKCYENYEALLAKRTEDIEKFVQSMKDETVSFIKFWQTCISGLNPKMALQNQDFDD